MGVSWIPSGLLKEETQWGRGPWLGALHCGHENPAKLQDDGQQQQHAARRGSGTVLSAAFALADHPPRNHPCHRTNAKRQVAMQSPATAEKLPNFSPAQSPPRKMLLRGPELGQAGDLALGTSYRRAPEHQFLSFQPAPCRGAQVTPLTQQPLRRSQENPPQPLQPPGEDKPMQVTIRFGRDGSTPPRAARAARAHQRRSPTGVYFQPRFEVLPLPPQKTRGAACGKVPGVGTLQLHSIILVADTNCRHLPASPVLPRGAGRARAA